MEFWGGKTNRAKMYASIEFVHTNKAVKLRRQFRYDAWKGGGNRL